MDARTISFSLMELFRMGGVFMWPLLVFSVAVIAISLERAIYLTYHDLRLGDISQKVSKLIGRRDFAGAAEYLRARVKRRMGARILLALVNRSMPDPGRGFSERRVERAAETEAMNCINSLENGFNFLTALGSLSPLTGFLGTVSGMIGAFRSIAQASDVNAQIVANGIYEALITTVFGLIIAIIAMIFHSIFSHVVDKFAAEVEKTCSNLTAEIVDLYLAAARRQAAARSQGTAPRPAAVQPPDAARKGSRS
jgi:biopolymer transport protein ExbB